MEISLTLLLLGPLIVLPYGHPILKGPESVTGTWKEDVIFQCVYTPLRGYSQVLLKWLVRHGSDPVTIFLRDATGDYIQQAKYRGRLKVSHEVPGDVSLQLNDLQMDDRSRYTCEVTWQTPDGNRVIRDKIIELRVRKYSSNPRIINTEAFTPKQSSLEITTTATTCDWTTKVNKVKEFIASTENGKHERTTTDPLKTTAGLGRELQIFPIIFIVFLCCIVVITIAYIKFCRRTFQQEQVYEVRRMCTRETSSSEETTKVTTFSSGYFNNDPDSQALISDYSDPQNYKVLATEDNSIC